MSIAFLLPLASSLALADTLDAQKADWSTVSVLAAAADPLYVADGILSGSVVGAIQDSDGDTLSITWQIDVAAHDDASKTAQSAVKGTDSYDTIDAFIHDVTRSKVSEGDTVYGIISDGTDENVVAAFVSTIDTIEGAIALNVADNAAVSTRVVWSDDGTVSAKASWSRVGATVRVDDGISSIVCALSDGDDETAIPGASWEWDSLGGLSKEDTGWFDTVLGGAHKDFPDFADFMDENGSDSDYSDTTYGDLGWDEVMKILEGKQTKEESDRTASNAQHATFMSIYEMAFDNIEERDDAEENGQPVPEGTQEHIDELMETLQALAGEGAEDDDTSNSDGDSDGDGDDDSDGDDSDETSTGDPDFEEDVDSDTLDRFTRVAGFLGIDPYNTDMLGEALGYRSEDDDKEDVDTAFLETTWLGYGCVTSGELCLTDEDEGAVYAEMFLMNMLCESGLCAAGGVGGVMSKTGLANLADSGVALGDGEAFGAVLMSR